MQAEYTLWYEAVKFWLPLATILGLIVQGWRSLVKKITIWVEKLLNNHLHHIEENTAEAAAALRETHAEFKTMRADQAVSFMDVRRDMMLFMDGQSKIQQSILTNLEILKDRQ